MAAETRRVRLHRAAERELEEAATWYDDQEPGLGTAFPVASRAGIEAVAAGPERWPIWPPGGRHRRLVLPRFPFNVFYRLVEAEIYIVAIAHQHRRPGYWSTRR